MICTKGTDPQWADVQWRRLMRASLGLEPNDMMGAAPGQPPNIALAEQSGQVG